MDRKRVDPMTQLMLCIGMDILGVITYVIPGAGEFADMVYAPIQGAVAWMMFGGESWGKLWTGIAFAEELAPLVDIMPSMTIGWVLKFVVKL